MYSKLSNDIFSSSDDKGSLNMNTLFWATLFQKNNVQSLVNELCKLKTVDSTKLQAVRSNPICFLQKVDKALTEIRCQSLSAVDCFNYLETLQIVCHILLKRSFTILK